MKEILCNNTIKLIKKILTVTTFIIGSVSIANAAVFAKYDGVDGESKDANHDKWIDVLSIDWGSNKPGGGATGQSRRRGSAIQEVQMEIKIDSATPHLFRSAIDGRVYRDVVIDACEGPATTICNPRPEVESHCYIQWKLDNVIITSYQVSASGD
jgi:type VI protein secretion system component Hcp